MAVAWKDREALHQPEWPDAARLDVVKRKLHALPPLVFAGEARQRLQILLQMAAVLTYGAALPVLKVGRIAGQFVKPRSSPVEETADGEIPVFRGHMVHEDAPTAA